MTLQDIVNLISENGGSICGFIVVLSLFVEVSPIKVNPWSSIAKFIGKIFSAYTSERIDAIESRMIKNEELHNESLHSLIESLENVNNNMIVMNKAIQTIGDKQEFTEAMTSRYRIIRGADELRNGQELSDEHIEQLGEDIETYDTYCKNHPNYKNHKGQVSKKLILDYEQERLKNKN
ncbi:MAG: hypothetical protein KBT03_08875 [Bacteroidales bacterium]|nr:hypothetical protein [Candidatus Scybalousia scybalohippi]